MCAHVLRFRFRRGVDVAANVEIVVVPGKLCTGHDARKLVGILEGMEGRDDLLDVLGFEVVLRPALTVVAVAINEEQLALTVGRLSSPRPQDKDAGGNTCPVE